MDITDAEFEAIIARAIEDLPPEHIQNMENVAIVYADEPSAEQLQKQGVRHGQLLLGLYEGIPLTARYSSSYSGVLPDKITLFKNSLLAISDTPEKFFKEVKRTLWHEMAHYYGLSHRDMDSRLTTE